MARRPALRILGSTAAAVALILTCAVPAHAAALTVKNPGFEVVTASGEPADWSVWRARGTGISAQSVAGAGPDGHPDPRRRHLRHARLEARARVRRGARRHRDARDRAHARQRVGPALDRQRGSRQRRARRDRLSGPAAHGRGRAEVDVRGALRHPGLVRHPPLHRRRLRALRRHARALGARDHHGRGRDHAAGHDLPLPRRREGRRRRPPGHDRRRRRHDPRDVRRPPAEGRPHGDGRGRRRARRVARRRGHGRDLHAVLRPRDPRERIAQVGQADRTRDGRDGRDRPQRRPHPSGIGARGLRACERRGRGRRLGQGRRPRAPAPVDRRRQARQGARADRRAG